MDINSIVAISQCCGTYYRLMCKHDDVWQQAVERLGIPVLNNNNYSSSSSTLTYKQRLLHYKNIALRQGKLMRKQIGENMLRTYAITKNSQPKSYDIAIKVVALGEGGVGKTALIERYVVSVIKR